MNTHSPLRQIVREVKLDLPENWREMKAREVFDLSKPFYLLFDQAPPKYRELAERIERYVQAQPEFRFPELMEADKAAHISYYQNENGVRVPLPENFERYGRSIDQWEVRGYDVENFRKQQQTPEERIYYEGTWRHVEEQLEKQWRRELDDEKKTGGANPSSSPKAYSKPLDRAAIIAANPLVDYVRKLGIELKQEGPRWRALCPIHDERTPSFTIGPDPNVWHCFGCGAGGSVIDLHAHLRGIEIREAMAELSPGAGPPKSEEIAAYTYCDEHGRPIFQVVRFAPKDFRQFRIDAQGQRIWKGGMGNTRRVPYHLPEVLAATEVLVVEGEKDADTLKRVGFVATTNPGGAGKWRSEYSEFFRGKRVFIIPDKDEVGRKHGEQVARSLVDAAVEAVFRVDLPEGIKDPSDFAEAEGSQFRERFDALLAHARRIDFPHSDNGPRPNETDIYDHDFEPEEPATRAADETRDVAWPKLQPLEEYLSPVLPMTADMMPEALGDWVSTIAAGLRCSLDFAAASAVVATSSVVASRVRMRPLHYKSWQIAPNLWGGTIGEPGTKKSPTMAEVFKPLDRLKIEEAAAFEKAEEAHQRALSDYARELKIYRDSIDRLRRKQVAGTADERDDQRLSQLKGDLEELLTREPKAPQRRRYRLNDPTIEALQKLLKTDHTCLLVDRDELMGMVAQWEMEGHQNDRPFFLESWGGLYPYDGARIGRGDFFIPCLCLALFGGIQPAKLVQYLRNPKVCLTLDGALQRFQLLVYPNRIPATRLVDEYENTEAKNRFFEIIKTLAHADFRDFGGMNDQFNPIPWFHFSIEAKKQFEEWHWKNELFIADKNTGPLLRQHFAKFDKLLCSIALIFHLIELAESKAREGYIPVRIFEQAVRWVEYLSSHAHRIYGLAENPSVSAAMLLGAKLKDPKIKNPLESGFTAYDVAHHHWVGLSSYEDINSALARLVDANWLREQPSKASEKGGRPTVHFEIHPRDPSEQK